MELNNLEIKKWLKRYSHSSTRKSSLILANCFRHSDEPITYNLNFSSENFSIDEFEAQIDCINPTAYFSTSLGICEPGFVTTCFEKCFTPFNFSCYRKIKEEIAVSIIKDILGEQKNKIQLNRSWRSAETMELAWEIYENKKYDQMPILGDYLKRLGCENQYILSHCQNHCRHFWGCWVVDLILGKN